ncbi:MAG: hypothetical protein Alis3KO_16990 [Aliiglaciecola sp.]
MLNISSPSRFTVAVVFLSFIVFSIPAQATWSIIAVDRDKGDIGIAGASCTFDVSGIASVIPGKGAIVVQAASNYFARMQGVKMMREEASVEKILESMKQENFTPSRQQYGVILLSEGTMPMVETGHEVKGFKGAKIDNDVAVMGNILVGQKVSDDAFNAFKSPDQTSFAEKMMSALHAGAKAGGDSRCGEQRARSAFISIYSSRTEAITTLSVYGTDVGGMPAVDLLAEKFSNL